MTANGNRDFDFLHGAWDVSHRRLRQRLQASDDWDEFSGTSTTRPILGGNGNIEENVLHPQGGSFHACALRTFDPASGSWSIWWLDGRNPGHLDPPVIGGFAGDVGTFLAEDVFEGVPIVVRFLWKRGSRQACRWEQAFRRKDASAWETNWVMEFRRAGS